MAYSTINKSTDYMNSVLYTSNSGSSPRTITGVGFNPDMIWVKNRDSASYNHVLSDNVRGIGKIIQPDTTVVEASNSGAGTITATNSDGFVLTAGSSNLSNYDTGTNKQVVWNWKANGAGSSNSDGSITSTVSASTASGFSIVKWTGSGGNATIGHGLGAVPKLIIVKSLANTTSWMVYHSEIGNNSEIYLNGNNAAAGSSTAWQDTDPTSSVFYVAGGGGDGVNASGDYVAYCFAEIQGHSKIGHYTGNGNADGAFVYCGFRPSFILTKTTGTDNWRILDDKRLGYNPNNSLSQPSVSQADSAQTWHDIVSNGFKLRTTDTGDNGAGTKYIFYAVGQTLVGTNDIPNNAR